MADKPPPLYTQDLARRLLAIIRQRLEQDKGLACAGRGFRMRSLSAKSGIPYWTLVNYITRSNTKLSLDQMDKILYAMELSVTDLIQPAELAARYDSLDRQVRYTIRKKASGKSPVQNSTENGTKVLEDSLDTSRESA